MDEANNGANAWRAIDLALAVAAAAIVAYGVLALGWSVFVVIALFWFENVVIGVLNVVKMLVSGVRIGFPGVIGALALAAFFTVHYGMFTVVHGVFVVMLFGQSELGGSSSGLFAPLAATLNYLFAVRDAGLAAAGIVVLQGAAFLRWWGATSAAAGPFPELMFAPYGRIVILHVTVIGGGILVSMLGAPSLGALLLVALKLAFDIVAANTSGTSAVTSAVTSGSPIRGDRLHRFDISAEDDARRP